MKKDLEVLNVQGQMLLCLQVNLNRGAGGRSLTQGDLFLVLPRAELPQSEGGNKDAK